jgi:hypothetical protein
MSEQDNVFPFGKYDSNIAELPDERILGVLNGLQQNLLLVVQKLDILEHRIKELESCSSETQK